MFQTKTIVALLMLALTSCSTSAPETAKLDQAVTYPGFEWLKSADPKRDLAAAWERNDKRFLGVYGYTPYTPGVPQSEVKFIAKYGVRYIEGTTDAIQSQKQMRAILKATEYAHSYNELLLKLLLE